MQQHGGGDEIGAAVIQAGLPAILLTEMHGQAHRGAFPVAQFQAGAGKIDADERQLGRAIGQLLDNAIKFSSDGQVVLQVKPIKLSIHRSHIEFVMQDCGIGIAAENLSSIFDPFEQVSMSETQSGLGMGLAICKQLVNRMKGSISAEACDRGARIRLQLPFQLPKDVPRAG